MNRRGFLKLLGVAAVACAAAPIIPKTVAPPRVDAVEQIQALIRALEAHGYYAAPGTLTQGSALQVEDLAPVMRCVTFDESHIKLQKAQLELF